MSDGGFAEHQRGYNEFDPSSIGLVDRESGMVSDQMSAVRDISQRAQAALQAWQSWEAINDAADDPAFVSGINQWNGVTGLAVVRQALWRDAFVRAFELSSPQADAKRIANGTRREQRTLCDVAAWLNLDGVRETLERSERGIPRSCPDSLEPRFGAEVMERYDRIVSRISPDGRTPPGDVMLHDLRQRLIEKRDAVAHQFAHRFDGPTVDDLRRLVGLTVELSLDAEFIWWGSAASMGSVVEATQESARTFWTSALRGVAADVFQTRGF